MRYTPAGIELLVKAVRRRRNRTRVDFMYDMRAVMNPKPNDMEKRVHQLEHPPAEDE